MRLRPLLDNVVIKPSKKEEVTTGGIIIPDTGTEGPVRGEVIAVGPGNYTEKGEYIPMNVSVGDEVLYGTKPEQKYRLMITNILSSDKVIF